MGSSVTIMGSLTAILGSDKAVAVIGDSTFCHSGVEGLINCAYNKVKGVIIILDNGTTAMTGAQPNPATGITAKGEQTKKLDLEKLCIACGADIVEVIDSSCSSIENKIKELTATNKLCVLIVRYSLCKMIDRTKKPAPKVMADKCKKCYMCITVDCPAILKDENGNIKIDNNLCAGCNVCAEQCKFGALEATK
jgi:indolepyruvate ferredoxin oxidoreductase alpha subunit